MRECFSMCMTFSNSSPNLYLFIIDFLSICAAVIIMQSVHLLYKYAIRIDFSFIRSMLKLVKSIIYSSSIDQYYIFIALEIIYYGIFLLFRLIAFFFHSLFESTYRVWHWGVSLWLSYFGFLFVCLFSFFFCTNDTNDDTLSKENNTIIWIANLSFSVEFYHFRFRFFTSSFILKGAHQ